MADHELAEGRARASQSWRTRAAIVTAAAELLEAGGRPTVAEAAGRAEVSKATAYRYFASQDALLLEATLQKGVLPALEALDRNLPSSSDPAKRLDDLVVAWHAFVQENERAIRELLRITLDADDARPDPAHPVRGAFRLRALASVVDLVVPPLTSTKRRDLIAGLSLAVGPEAQLVLRDVNGLTPAQSLQVSRDVAQAVLRAWLSPASDSRSAAE